MHLISGENEFNDSYWKNIEHDGDRFEYRFKPYGENDLGGLEEDDEQLEEWLTQHDIDEVSKNIILNEGFSYEDFIHNMEKLDLMRLELR